MTDLTAKIRDRVKKCQVIAKSGTTGWITHLGPHLHFMVGEYGKTVEEYETVGRLNFSRRLDSIIFWILMIILR